MMICTEQGSLTLSHRLSSQNQKARCAVRSQVITPDCGHRAHQMPDPASFRLRSVRDEAAMRDAELLPSRVRRSDDLKCNRADGGGAAMIKRAPPAPTDAVQSRVLLDEPLVSGETRPRTTPLVARGSSWPTAPAVTAEGGRCQLCAARAACVRLTSYENGKPLD